MTRYQTIDAQYGKPVPVPCSRPCVELLVLPAGVPHHSLLACQTSPQQHYLKAKAKLRIQVTQMIQALKRTYLENGYNGYGCCS